MTNTFAYVHMNRVTEFKDASGRPAQGFPSSCTIEQAAKALASADTPMFVEVRWQVTPSAPVSVERQITAKTRRVRKMAKLAGRILSRVEPIHGFPTHYRALLAR
jgi:hypothetical protein